jgi:thiamine biosynthesis protein ThiI
VPDCTYLVKPGELVLKGDNKPLFERLLRRNLSARLKGSGAQLNFVPGRFYIRAPEAAAAKVEYELDHLLGISGWSLARPCEKTVSAVAAACIAEAREQFLSGKKTFKVEARRSDKSFPLDSYGICREAGEKIREAFPQAQVDVHRPDFCIWVEIRERAFVYSGSRQGRRGLPVGSAGKGLLLLSGGIDSPVAGYMMAARGLRIQALYFHAFPYTSEEARQKVIRLAEILGAFAMGVRLHIVSFTKVQMRIKEKCPLPWTTVLLRMAMMECAGRIACAQKLSCIITGESLSQVASQTLENIACIASRSSLPVLRPLIGLDKEEITKVSRAIGAYETSILPYEDCCVLFSPPHPVLRANPAEAARLYEALDLGPLLEEALSEETVKDCCFR